MLREIFESNHPLVWWLGWLLTVAPLVAYARYLGISDTTFAAFIDEYWWQFYWFAWINGVATLFIATLFILAGGFLLVLHLVGVL